MDCKRCTKLEQVIRNLLMYYHNGITCDVSEGFLERWQFEEALHYEREAEAVLKEAEGQ